MRQVLLVLAVIAGFFGLAFVTAVFVLKLTTHRTTLHVPDLVGMDVSTATQTLEKINLKFDVSKEVFSPTFEMGLIVKQRPEAGLEVKSGRTISAIVSKGLKKIIVPKLDGETLTKAQETLKNYQLGMGEITYIHNQTEPEGAIIATNPPVGEAADTGEEVHLLVSMGADKGYTMPDLLGMSLPKAISLIQEQNLALQNIGYKMSDFISPNQVILQSPLSGAKINEKALVTLTVSRLVDGSQPNENKMEILHYSLPDGLVSGKVTFLLEDESGSEVLLEEQLEQGNSINLPIEISPGKRFKILLNGRIVEEKGV